MSQATDLQMPTTGPVSPLAYTNELNTILDAIATHNKGSSAPGNPVQAMFWIDDTANPNWTLKFYDGTDWIPLFTVNSTNNTVDIIKSDNSNQWSKQQYYSASSLTDGTNVSWNLDDSPSAKVTLAGNRTLDNPSNLKDGMTYMIKVVQDATGSRTLSYGSAYDWTALGGSTPTLSTTANAEDLLVFYSDGTKMYGINNANIKG